MKILEKRGFCNYLGVKPGKNYNNGIVEKFTDNHINKKYSNFERNCYVNFGGNKENIPVLDLLDTKVEIISNLTTICGTNLGPCITFYQNNLGGNVVVSTYMFTNFLEYIAKRTQMINLFDKLSNGHLSVIVNKDHKITSVMRKKSDGKFVLLIANMSCDNSGSFTIDLRDVCCPCDMITESGEIIPLKSKEIYNGIQVEIENISPWNGIIISNQYHH